MTASSKYWGVLWRHAGINRRQMPHEWAMPDMVQESVSWHTSRLLTSSSWVVSPIPFTLYLVLLNRILFFFLYSEVLILYPSWVGADITSYITFYTNWKNSWLSNFWCYESRLFNPVVPNFFGTRDIFCGRQFFHEPGVVGWFQNDLRALFLLCTFFLLLYQFSHRSSGIRSQRLGTPANHSLTWDGDQRQIKPSSGLFSLKFPSG